MNSNCSNLLKYEEQVKKAFCYQNFHCLDKLFYWSQTFFSITRTFFSHSRSEQFWWQNTITDCTRLTTAWHHAIFLGHLGSKGKDLCLIRSVFCLFNFIIHVMNSQFTKKESCKLFAISHIFLPILTLKQNSLSVNRIWMILNN